MRKFAINGFSGCLVAALVLVGVTLLTLMFLRGGVWLGEKALPIFQWLARITLGVVVIILLPMATYHKTQRAAANGLVQASSLFGITLWVWALVLTYSLWGGGAVLVGIFLLGVGVVPMAMVATAIAKMWPTFWQLMALAALAYGTRRIGKKLLLKLRMREEKIYETEAEIVD